MDPAMLEGFSEEDKAKMMGMIEAMQTRDRCVDETRRATSDEARDTRTNGGNDERAIVFLCLRLKTARVLTMRMRFFKSRRCSLKMYNNLVERCFSTCVQSFRRKSLEKDEERVRFIDERRRVDVLLTVSFVLFLP